VPVRGHVGSEIECVYREQGDRIWRAVFLSTGDREVASDAVAEAFAQALRRGDAIRSPERWVWRTAFRIAAAEMKRGRETNEALSDRVDDVGPETAALLGALPRLSPKQRASIVLRYHAGYTLKEVAEIIGSTPSAVGVHIHRGRMRLRELREMVMPDLRTRFRGADRIPAPDLWEDIARWEPRPAVSGLSASRRLMITSVAFALAAGAIAFAVLAFSVNRQRTPISSPSMAPKANGVIYFQVGGGDAETWTDEVRPDGSGERQAFAPEPVHYDEIAWSPNGTRIAYGDNLVGHFGIYTANPDGTDDRRLTDGVNDGWPSWSPDGTRIAFSSSGGAPDAKPCGSGAESMCPADIYVMNADGTAVTRLTDDPASEYQPAWSPVGTKIAFVRSNGNGVAQDLYVMNADGTNPTPLAAGAGTLVHPTWSPDGSRIAFTGFDGKDLGIFVVNADGTGLTELFSEHGWVAEYPAWSPDGTKIAFNKWADQPDIAGCDPESTCESQIYLMNPDGTGVTKLTDVPEGGSRPAWQPVPVTTVGPTPTQITTPAAPQPASNGLIAFGEGTGIYTMNQDGRGLTLLQDPGAVAYYDPQWSPDGTKIAFYGYPRGGGSGYGGGADYDILVMNTDGSGLTNLTTSPADVKSGFSQMIPVWSPDGTKIAYDGDDGLYVMNADGSDQTRISAGQDPSWSPDGTRIAFEGPGGAIWSVAPDGSGLAQLTSGAGFDGFPTYSPDGIKIAYYHGQGSDRAIYVMNADGSGQTVVADFQADTMGRPVWSPDGTKIAFDLLLTSYSEHGTWDIYVANADGTGVTDLTPTPNRDENTPVWSPDGTEIAFEASDVLARDTDNTGTFDIYVMNPNGTDQTRLTKDVHSFGFDMSWQTLPN
jgi:RNA polymerase sigma factor (sigma-70 family)